MSDASESRIREAYVDGVSAIRDAVASLGASGARRSTPCPAWNALELVTHLWCTADRYHRLLDAAVAGHPEPMLINDELAETNERAVEAAATTSLEEALASFVASAEAYLPRALAKSAVTPYQRGGQSSIGDALGLAAIEWHLHAWDLRRSAGAEYRPACAETLRDSWNRAVPHLPIVTDADPWAALLRAAERTQVT